MLPHFIVHETNGDFDIKQNNFLFHPHIHPQQNNFNNFLCFNKIDAIDRAQKTFNLN